jgi:hypothetical protein
MRQTYERQTRKQTQSIISYSSSPLDFHIVADPSSQEYLEGLLSLVHKPVYDIRVFFYPISERAMTERLGRTARPREGYPAYGALGTTHPGGKGE